MPDIGKLIKEGLASALFVYSTQKVVQIKSKSVGIVNRLGQLLIIGYIIGYVLIYSKGYQEEDIGVSGTTTKVKGVTYTDSNDSRVGRRVWDSVDLVVPAEENNAFFVTTNVILTNNQSQGECPESSAVSEAHCTNNTSCEPIGRAYELGHGVSTGVCNAAAKTCMVQAWCPLEQDQLTTNTSILNGTENFTVLIKSHAFFPKFGVSRSNILQSTDKNYLKQCNYDKENNPYCPIFRLGYIIQEAQRNTGGDYDSIAYEGGVISIKIRLRCDLDVALTNCKPEYTFDRLDGSQDSLIAKGYNYRYSNNYFNGLGIEYRQLIKAYGILFIITADVRAYRFNVVPTFTNIGSGIALLAIATVVCDIFVLYLHEEKITFKGHKYENVTTSDAFQILSSGEHSRDNVKSS